MTNPRLIRAFLGIALGFLILGCGREGRGVALSSEAELKQAEAEESKGAWTYNSKKDGFSLKLPSTNWKEMAKKNHIADFWNNRFGSPMLAGVFSIKKQTHAEFQDLMKQFKEEQSKDADLLVKPTIREGVNSAGNAYVFLTLCEKGKGKEQYIYAAKSYTWIKDKGITVEVLFEGQGKMQSKLFQSVEYTQFEKAARTICLSVDKAKEPDR